ITLYLQMAKGSKKNDLRNAARGMGALLGGSRKQEEEELVEETILNNTVATIPLKDISVNPKQPRRHFDEEALKQLSDSITAHGLIQPITVRQLTNGKYQLISGERRFRASKLAQLEEITAFVRETGDEEMHVLALIENIQREDLNPIEVAISLQLLKEEKGFTTDDQLAAEVGKSRPQVANYKRLLKLPPTIVAAVRDRVITFGHARAIAGLKNVDTQLVVFKEMVDKGMSVREAEELVNEYKPRKKKKGVDKRRGEHYDYLKKKLTEYFSLKAEIKPTDGDHGEIIMKFKDDDIDRIAELLEE
ncbi:MAG: ParB/RepB/Spo0J family partition protein, partial [Bacteroidota bacterium]